MSDTPDTTIGDENAVEHFPNDATWAAFHHPEFENAIRAVENDPEIDIDDLAVSVAGGVRDIGLAGVDHKWLAGSAIMTAFSRQLRGALA